MPTYISLIEWTQDGIENVEDSPARLDDARELAESLGGELTGFYLTFGQYDIVTVAEFPDDETYAQFALRVASGGSVSTETLKAFPEDDYREIIDGLPG
jgi:uncharacterized protein with GYD domain